MCVRYKQDTVLEWIRQFVNPYYKWGGLHEGTRCKVVAGTKTFTAGAQVTSLGPGEKYPKTGIDKIFRYCKRCVQYLSAHKFSTLVFGHSKISYNPSQPDLQCQCSETKMSKTGSFSRMASLCLLSVLDLTNWESQSC